MTKAHLGWWSGERYWQCTTRVYSGDRADMRGHLCGHTAKFDPDSDGNPTKCGLHSAEGEAKRKAKNDAKWLAHKAKADRASLEFTLTREAREIVRQVAEGHNDARGLCAEWVARWDATK